MWTLTCKPYKLVRSYYKSFEFERRVSFNFSPRTLTDIQDYVKSCHIGCEILTKNSSSFLPSIIKCGITGKVFTEDRSRNPLREHQIRVPGKRKPQPCHCPLFSLSTNFYSRNYRHLMYRIFNQRWLFGWTVALAFISQRARQRRSRVMQLYLMDSCESRTTSSNFLKRTTSRKNTSSSTLS